MAIAVAIVSGSLTRPEGGCPGVDILGLRGKFDVLLAPFWKSSGRGGGLVVPRGQSWQRWR